MLPQDIAISLACFNFSNIFLYSIKSYIENVKSSSFLIKIFSLSPITDVLGTIISPF